MRPHPAPTPAPDDAQPQRAFTRRIECDGSGYAAAPLGPARGGGRREPDRWREPRGDVRG
ncbi:MAG: hypothetical protein ACJ8GN_17780 [Longimicrobiaceae bacterium]